MPLASWVPRDRSGSLEHKRRYAHVISRAVLAILSCRYDACLSVALCKHRSLWGGMSVMSVRLPDEVDLQLGQLAQSTGRTKSWLANQAIQDYLSREAWQIAEVEAALREADAGDFVSEKEMMAKFNRWGINAG